MHDVSKSPVPYMAGSKERSEKTERKPLSYEPLIAIGGQPESLSWKC